MAIPGMRRWLLAVLAVALALWMAWPFLATAAFLMDIAGSGGLVRSLLPSRREAVSSEDLMVPTRDGAVAGRLYHPASASGRTVVVFPGVHGGGVDEPRLDRFSGRLASTGLTVLSVPLPDLRVFSVTGRSTDMIEDAAVWAAGSARIAPAGRVAIVGVSFSGGLALVAAGRPALADRVELVLSLGGHGDLARALHYLCTGVLPDGSYRVPHEYGLAIVTLAAVPRLVPPDQVPALSAGVRTYLDAALEDPPGAGAEALLASARDTASRLPEPARTILTWVNQHDVADLGRRLDPLIDDLAADPALSPERSPATRAPVFLLHGRDDNVIPSSETPLLARYLERSGNAHVQSLLTPALSHAGLFATVPVSDGWRLIRFWKTVMDAAQ